MEKNIDEVLQEVFSQKPLPNKLKMPKKRFQEGNLKELAKINIIRKYSDYEIVLYCKKIATNKIV